MEAFKHRRLSPVSPPTVSLAAAVPIIWLGVFALMAINTAGLLVAEMLLIGYGVITVFSAVSVYKDMKSCKGVLLITIANYWTCGVYLGMVEVHVEEHKSIAFG